MVGIIRNFLRELDDNACDLENKDVMHLKQEISELFYLGLVRGKYDASERNLLEKSRGIMKKALKECPVWATKCAIYGQETNEFKQVSVQWLVFLSTLEDKSLFERAFVRIIINPHLLSLFIDMVKNAGIRQGMGRSVKRVVNSWLNTRLSEENVMKYKKRLEFVVRTSRPIVLPKNQTYIEYILGNKEDGFQRADSYKEVIDALAKGRIDARILGLIRKNGFTMKDMKEHCHNMSRMQKRILFETFVYGLSYGDLASSLPLIESVFRSDQQTKPWIKEQENGEQHAKTVDIPPELILEISKKLSDYGSFRRSKLNPFDLMNAIEKTSIPSWKTKIGEVLLRSGREAFNVPLQTGVRVGLDGSLMAKQRLAFNLCTIDIAAYLCSMIFLSIRDASVYINNTRAARVDVRKYGSMTDNAEMIKNAMEGVYTAQNDLLEDYRGEKYVIILTNAIGEGENEERWDKLRNKPAGAKLIIWNLIGVRHTGEDKKDVIYLQGFHKNVLNTLKSILEDRILQSNYLNDMRV